MVIPPPCAYKELRLTAYDCAANLDDGFMIRNLFDHIAVCVGTTILDRIMHHFPKQGTTALAILGASHIAYHSSPEHKQVSIDISSCAKDPEKCVILIRAFLKPKDVSWSCRRRQETA